MNEKLDYDKIGEAKKTFSTLGMALFVFVLGSLGTQLILSQLLPILINNFGLELNSYLVYGMSSLPIYLVGFPLFIKFIGKLPKISNEEVVEKFNLLTMLQYFSICTVGMFVGNLIGVWIMSSIASYTGREVNSNLEILVTNTDTLSTIIFVVILAPIMEELIFRKLLIDKIAEYGKRTAVLFSAFSFALFHMNILQFFYTFIIGYVLGTIYVKTKKIAYSIGLHMVINFMGSVVAVFISKQFTEKNIEILNTGNIELIKTVFTGSFIISALYTLFLFIFICFGIAVFFVKRKKLFHLDGEMADRRTMLWLIFSNYGMAFFVSICMVMTVFSIITQLV